MAFLQAIVIHPKRDLMDEEEEEVKEKPVPKYVVSGGLTGFGVANDLMFIDFSPPEEAPEEFRAMPYNAKKITTLKSGVSGTGWTVLQQPMQHPQSCHNEHAHAHRHVWQGQSRRRHPHRVPQAA